MAVLAPRPRVARRNQNAATIRADVGIDVRRAQERLVRLVIQVRPDHQDPQSIPGRLGLRERQVVRETLERRDRKEFRERLQTRARQVPTVLRELPVLMERRSILARLDLQVRQAREVFYH